MPSAFAGSKRKRPSIVNEPSHSGILGMMSSALSVRASSESVPLIERAAHPIHQLQLPPLNKASAFYLEPLALQPTVESWMEVQVDRYLPVWHCVSAKPSEMLFPLSRRHSAIRFGCRGGKWATVLHHMRNCLHVFRVLLAVDRDLPTGKQRDNDEATVPNSTLISALPSSAPTGPQQNFPVRIWPHCPSLLNTPEGKPLTTRKGDNDVDEGSMRQKSRLTQTSFNENPTDSTRSKKKKTSRKEVDNLKSRKAANNFRSRGVRQRRGVGRGEVIDRVRQQLSTYDGPLARETGPVKVESVGIVVHVSPSDLPGICMVMDGERQVEEELMTTFSWEKVELSVEKDGASDSTREHSPPPLTSVETRGKERKSSALDNDGFWISRGSAGTRGKKRYSIDPESILADSEEVYATQNRCHTSNPPSSEPPLRPLHVEVLGLMAPGGGADGTPRGFRGLNLSLTHRPKLNSSKKMLWDDPQRNIPRIVKQRGLLPASLDTLLRKTISRDANKSEQQLFLEPVPEEQMVYGGTHLGVPKDNEGLLCPSSFGAPSLMTPLNDHGPLHSDVQQRGHSFLLHHHPTSGASCFGGLSPMKHPTGQPDVSRGVDGWGKGDSLRRDFFGGARPQLISEARRPAAARKGWTTLQGFLRFMGEVLRDPELHFAPPLRVPDVNPRMMEHPQERDNFNKVEGCRHPTECQQAHICPNSSQGGLCSGDSGGPFLGHPDPDLDAWVGINVRVEQWALSNRIQLRAQF
ncbi:unnamed protein product [Cyprideis torosa]|uniref:Uncharacterized protein n=1 Tax=Cyprideis torosa TaxID=163714 RepID=A0A7R8W446_9CRUS|nr:unnamed protein product [Cyprideis torosa]CAG0880257.1 unnamed protein product [Cyprideis torosa]